MWHAPGGAPAAALPCRPLPTHLGLSGSVRALSGGAATASGVAPAAPTATAAPVPAPSPPARCTAAAAAAAAAGGALPNVCAGSSAGTRLAA